MSPLLATRPVEPTGSSTSPAFVMRSGPGGRRCGLENLTLPTYPPSPEGEELRRFRVEVADLVLREAARRTGLSPADLSGLERGSLTFVDPRGWSLARSLLLSPPAP